MEEITETDAGNGLFIVRLGSADSYRICQGLQTVAGSHTLPGATSTVADLVASQKLEAAFMRGKPGGVKTMTFEPQSGSNVTVQVQN